MSKVFEALQFPKHIIKHLYPKIVTDAYTTLEVRFLSFSADKVVEIDFFLHNSYQHLIPFFACFLCLAFLSDSDISSVESPYFF